MLQSKLATLVLSLVLSGVLLAGELTPEQQSAKEKGIALYNQYKDGR